MHHIPSYEPLCYTNIAMSKLILLLQITTMFTHQVPLSLSQGIMCSNSSFKDVVFVIDTSSSIGGRNQFNRIREFTGNITAGLVNNSYRNAVGIISFSTTPKIEFNLTTYSNSSALLSAIGKLSRHGDKPTNISKALSLLTSTAQNGELGIRNDSSKIAIVITDGQSKDMQGVSSAAAELHSSNLFDVHVVGIGMDHQDQLKKIASSSAFVYFINNLKLVNDHDLQQIKVSILEQLCTETKIDSGLCNNQSLQMKEETNCIKYEYTDIQDLINKSCEADFLSELILALENLLATLVNRTDPINNNTLASCSDDLVNIILSLEFIVNTTQSNPGILSSQKIIQNTTAVFSNILDRFYYPGWMELQKRNPPFNQGVLLLSERFGFLLAENLNEDRLFKYKNILITTKLVNSSSDVSFNGSGIEFNNSISIPAKFIQERSNITGITSIPIVTIQYRNIQDILPITENSTHRVQPVSQVLSSQVTNRSDTSSKSAVNLTLQYSLVNYTSNDSHILRCGFWNFSLNEGSGDWDTRGVQIIANDRNNSIITCNSSHLTSFAILVDVSGGHKDLSDHERRALSIISYIGCVISLFCLLIAIILLIYYRNTLLKGIHNFIHLNLAIALFLALIVFVSGIETATKSEVGCTIVAALLHYFFTAVFTWMLCEGIMLYFYLVKIFNTGLGQRRLFYFALGWGIPVPIVAVSAGVAHDQYGHVDFCWINHSKGAIWAFVGPMIVIIILNVLFLLLALRSLYIIKRRKLPGKEASQATFVKVILKATVILLPLLGITWVFGILAVNQESSVFAWIFTILNSLQGFFILVFHVIRNEKIWHKISSNWKDRTHSFIIPSSQQSPIASRSTKIKKSIGKTTSNADVKQDANVDAKQEIAIDMKQQEEAVTNTTFSMDTTVPSSNNKT